MSTSPPIASRKASVELKKLELEVRQLKRQNRWYWMQLPVLSTGIGTLVAALGIIVTAAQFQRTEQARIQNETAERINKIQEQIQLDEGLLTGFENDPRMSAAQAGLLMEGLGRLVRQLPERETEEEHVTDHIRDVVWSLNFQQKRDFDFELQALSRWAPYRKHWQSNPESHDLFLSRMYYQKIDSQKSCFQQVNLRGDDYDYSKMPKDCDKDLIGALIYGFGEHLRIDRKQLDGRINSFVSHANNAALGEQLKRQVLARQITENGE